MIEVPALSLRRYGDDGGKGAVVRGGGGGAEEDQRRGPQGTWWNGLEDEHDHALLTAEEHTQGVDLQKQGCREQCIVHRVKGGEERVEIGANRAVEGLNGHERPS